jgi:hypothetical protein
LPEANLISEFVHISSAPWQGALEMARFPGFIHGLLSGSATGSGRQRHGAREGKPASPVAAFNGSGRLGSIGVFGFGGAAAALKCLEAPFALRSSVYQLVFATKRAVLGKML